MASGRYSVSVAVTRLNKTRLIGAESIALTDAGSPGGINARHRLAERIRDHSLALHAEANLMLTANASESIAHLHVMANQKRENHEQGTGRSPLPHCSEDF